MGSCGAGGAPELASDMLGHADWVNDLALRPELLASCSSDRTVRLWRPEGARGAFMNTCSLGYHCLFPLVNILHEAARALSCGKQLQAYATAQPPA